MTGWFWRRHGRGDPDEEVDREVAFHLKMRAQELEERGMDPESARELAATSFGDVQAIRGILRSARRRRYVQRTRRERVAEWAYDVRHAGRLLRRNPFFTAGVVATLGAGIALIAVWASLEEAYEGRTLPFPDAERLVMVQGMGAPEWRDMPESFEQSVSWDLDVLSIVSDRPETVETSWVTADFFTITGARPELGRFFRTAETGPGSPAVAVISHALWQRRWGGAPDIIGRTFRAYSSDRPDEAEVFTIIGVLPADFWFTNRFHEVLAPLRSPRAAYMAKLRPGVRLGEAEAQLRRLASPRDTARADLRLVPIRAAYLERIRPMLAALGGAVLLVLGIAFGNAASLVLVRATAREPEFALRSAIGAGGGRLGRQLLVEGVWFSALASLSGVVLAWLVLRFTGGLLPRILGTPVPGASAGLVFGKAAAGAAILVFVLLVVTLAVVPLHRVWRPGLPLTLTEGARGMVGQARQRARSVLVAGELALSLSLLIGAGLLVRNALHMQAQPLGFDPDGLVAITASLRQREFEEAASRSELFERLAAGIERGVPGVSAEIVGWAPLSRSWSFPVETPEPAGAEPTASAFITSASPGYFGLMGIALLRGRTFEPTDRAGAPPVAIVSEGLARRVWPGGDPIGQRIRIAPVERAMGSSGWMGRSGSGFSSDEQWRTVVGVVADVTKTLVDENPPDLYYPLDQAPPMLVEFVVRGLTGGAGLAAAREAMWTVNPEIPLDEVRWLEEELGAALLPSRFLAWLLSAFGGFAILMAVTGISGVVAYEVSQRKREVAIRMALGATSDSVVGAFLRSSAAFLSAGLLIGLGGGWAVSRLISHQLHGVSASDPLTWVGAAAGLALVALIATWLPARRAARTEPMQVLQSR
jgi:putative ABC transport system permease protein